MKLGAAYVRVSDERQDEYSPDSQLKLVREYANKNGYVIPEEYVYYDDGISGRTARKRGQFQEMVAHAKNGEFEAVFVWKFSRFARNQEESIVYKSLLRKHGVAVISVSEPVGDDVYGSLIERIIEWMDEFYLIRLSDEVKRGMAERRARGEPVSVAPFGYDIVDKRFVQNDDAKWVKEIFNSFLAGEALRPMALRLAAEGVRTRMGGPPDNRFIEYVLYNSAYIGKIRWREDKERVDRCLEYAAEVDGNHEPIISDEIWERAQKKLAMRKKQYGKNQRKEQKVVQYMLKGLIRCSNCGATLCLGQWVPQRLQCHNYARGTCKVSHSVALDKVNAAVIAALREAVAGVAFGAARPTREAERPDYTKLIEAERRKLERVKQAYLNGVDTLEEYQQAKRVIESVIEEYSAPELGRDEPEETGEEYAARVREIVEYIEDESVSERKKNEALRTIISKIVYVKDKGAVEVHYI